MRRTNEANWILSNFVVMGGLIFGTGLLIDLAWRKAGQYRIATVIGIIILFLWLWAELAVGVFTNLGG
ncbi:MAG: hypothetical protein WEC83_02050 [Patescibacteria group bacterium]